MTRLVFHLGDRKTGSTSIQNALAAKAWRAKGVKLLYPRPNQLNHVPLARSLTEKKSEGKRDGRWGAVARELDAKRPDIAVISAEHFESVDPEVLRDAIEHYLPGMLGQARFIAYVRPHADRVVSEFAEQVKQGHFFGTMEELHGRILKRGRFFYAPRFARWRATFGDAFELRPMIRDRLRDGDVVTDFLDFAFDGHPFRLVDPPASNESLSLEDLSMLRELQKLIGKGETAAKASELQIATGWTLSRRCAAHPGAPRTKLAMHRALAERVARDYADDAAALDAAFFPDGPLSAALAAAPGKALDTAQSIEAADHFSPGELRLIHLWTAQMAEMLLADPEGWPKFFRSRHRARIMGEGPDAARPASPEAG